MTTSVEVSVWLKKLQELVGNVAELKRLANLIDPHYDTSYWCDYCRARTADKCRCGAIAEHD